MCFFSRKLQKLDDLHVKNPCQDSDIRPISIKSHSDIFADFLLQNSINATASSVFLVNFKIPLLLQFLREDHGNRQKDHDNSI